MDERGKRGKGGGYRSTGSWRYRTIKHYKHRAQKFQDKADTPEEAAAWGSVIQWFDSILARSYMNERDAIALPVVTTEELDIGFEEKVK